MAAIPRFVSFVAVALGVYDLVRAVAHTVYVGYAATELAGLDLSGPTGRDQLVLMIAFGASNFITGAALILFGLISRLGALILLSVIPAAYVVAGAALEYWGADLIGQGAFPGREKMKIYILLCVVTVLAALAMRWRRGRVVATPG